MRILLAALMLLLGAGFQASPLNHLLPIRLDPLLVMVVSWSLASGSQGGALFGLAAGTVQEGLVGGGLTLLPRLILGAAIGRLKPLLFYRQAPVVLPLLIVATCAHETLVAAQLALQGHVEAFGRLGAMLLPEAIGNLIIGWPIYLLVRWVLHQVPPGYRTRTEALEP